jgi:hypothetical protein
MQGFWLLKQVVYIAISEPWRVNSTMPLLMELRVRNHVWKYIKYVITNPMWNIYYIHNAKHGETLR